MEENKTLEMENVEVQEVAEETTTETYYPEESSDYEETDLVEYDDESNGSSGLLWMAAGAAAVVGVYAGGKWLWKKGKATAKNLWEKHKAKKEEYEEDGDVVIDVEANEVSMEDLEKECK